MAAVANSPAKPETEQNLIVALRTRPLNEEELLNGATTICHRVDNKMVVLMDPQEDPDDILRANRTREKQFVFDHALDGTSSQEEVYQKTSQYVIPSVIQGYNATVFAYGATGAGKTYTMLGTDDEPGIMARSLNDLFKEMERCSEDYSYSVSMSYLEIYNEMIRDLLNPETGYLELREDSKGVQVPGLKEMDAHTSLDVMQMLLKGNKERTQEPTAANKTSSRSHAVLQVSVKQRPKVHGTVQEVRTGKLFLIDLAGSERAAATHNRGKRMVEGAHINRSLLALGNCINALSDKNGAKYVNFRDSKLTRLLKDALGGNCKTVMIAHVGPASWHFEETRNTLLYAERARNIKTKVKRNVMDVQFHIHQYTNIIAELREEVKRLHAKLDNQQMNSKNSSAIHAIQREVMTPHPTSHVYQDKPVYQNGQVFIPGQGYTFVHGHLPNQNLIQTSHGYFTPVASDVPLHPSNNQPRPLSQLPPLSEDSAAGPSRIPRPLSHSDGGSVSTSERRSGNSRNLSSAHSMRSIRSNVTALTEILEENASIFGMSEVLEASQREDESGLTRLKDQLVNVFRDQMDLRRSLMDLDNTGMEIRLETARNQLLIQKAEKERTLAKRRKERERETKEKDDEGNVDDDENPKDADKEKVEKQLSRSDTFDYEETEEVKNAKYDLIALGEEREKTEKLKVTMSKELANAREKAGKMEELLPKRMNSSEQHEVLSLLVKVHELEIDNMEMQSACLLRNFEIRRKNMVLSKYQQHLSLCDEIIQQQKTLLDEYMVTSPKDLEELYDMYGQEDNFRSESAASLLPDPYSLAKGMSLTSLNRRPLESDSMSDMDRLTVLNEEQSPNGRLLAPIPKRQLYRNIKPTLAHEEDKIFSRSAKAQEIRAAQVHDDAINMTAMANAGLSRQRSIITLSSHSTSPSPPVDPTPRPAAIKEYRVNSQREVIASKTRNIAALAAARKNKAHLNAYNNERLGTFASLQGRENVLTTSRLAQHDKDFAGSEVTLNHLIDDDLVHANTADEGLPVAKSSNPAGPGRGRYRSNNIHSRISTQPPVRKPVTVKKRSRSQDISNYPSRTSRYNYRGKSTQLSKTTPTRRANDTTGGMSNFTSRRQKITPAATRTGTNKAASRANYRNDDIREFESEQTPPTSVQQSNADKGPGLTIQKRVRGPAFGTDKSSTSTPRKGRPTNKRPPPSIPAGYRKTDIAIAGFGIGK